MKTIVLKAVGVFLFASSLTCLQAKVVTVTISQERPSGSVVIGTNEVGKILTSMAGGQAGVTVIAVINGKTNYIYGVNAIVDLRPNQNITIAGPAEIRLFGGQEIEHLFGFCTVQIEPESFPPDKALIIPADTKGANVIMEASPDLVHWTNSVPGVYTNLTGNMFFRIRAERIP
jgi:hypothetical protein